MYHNNNDFLLIISWLNIVPILVLSILLVINCLSSLICLNYSKRNIKKITFLGNDESDESEDTHDEDEDEELRTSYSPTRNNNEIESDSNEELNESLELNTSDQSIMWS